MSELWKSVRALESSRRLPADYCLPSILDKEPDLTASMGPTTADKLLQNALSAEREREQAKALGRIYTGPIAESAKFAGNGLRGIGRLPAPERAAEVGKVAVEMLIEALRGDGAVSEEFFGLAAIPGSLSCTPGDPFGADDAPSGTNSEIKKTFVLFAPPITCDSRGEGAETYIPTHHPWLDDVNNVRRGTSPAQNNDGVEDDDVDIDHPGPILQRLFLAMRRPRPRFVSPFRHADRGRYRLPSMIFLIALVLLAYFLVTR